jgi:YD repeat-containing protein
MRRNFDGLSTMTETQTTYEDSNLRVVTERDLSQPGLGGIVSATEYDQLGRVYLTRQLETPNSTQADWDNDSEGIRTQTQYRYGTGASYKLVSNPYRSTSDATMGWLLTTYDTDGRVTGTQYFSGAAQPSPWGNNGTTTGSTSTAYGVNTSSANGAVLGQTMTSTDEASTTRQSTMDSLGRLAQVVEDPNGLGYTTTYSYDAMDNLIGVTQGTETRTFTYDSLKRLSRATNPESGTIAYTYDNDGNLVTKTDAARTTCFGNFSGSSCDGSGIDSLNRTTLKTYNDSPNTP